MLTDEIIEKIGAMEDRAKDLYINDKAKNIDEASARNLIKGLFQSWEKIDDLKQQLSEARAVIEYYDDPAIYDPEIIPNDSEDPVPVETWCEKAREYLKKYEEGK